MSKVKIKDKQLMIGEQKLPLLSGEVHYWRLFPEAWADILDTVKDMGLKIVSTYIPWQYHEIRESEYDFTGRTSGNRDLVRFIKLVQEKKLWLIVRPGPYLYTEWVNRGIPDYMVKYHRNHEQFRKKSAEYIKTICQVIKPFLASSKGNIIMVQADNEIDIWSKLYEQDLGLLDQPGSFQVFLKKKYSTISQLNQVWGTELKDFNEAKPVTQNIIDDDFYKKRFYDYCEFRHDYSREFAFWVVAEYKKYIDVPVYLNAYPWVDVQNWREFQAIADIVGIDQYPGNEYSNSPTEQRCSMDGVRYTRTFTSIPYIAEFECGVWHGMHYVLKVLTPNHYRLICLSVLQAGVAGWNWYMLVNRDNWYMCPINEWGRKRQELFPVFKQIVELYNQLNPAECVKLTDTAATYDILQAGSYLIKPDNAVLHSLYEADIDYEFYDVETGQISKKLLFYANEQFLSARAQQQLSAYINQGGTLVIFQDFPRKDENFQYLNKLDVKEPDRILEPCILDLFLGKQSCQVNSPIFVYDDVPGEKIMAKISRNLYTSLEEENLMDALVIDREYCIGYLQKRGKGQLLVLGVKPSKELMGLIHDYFKVVRPAQSMVSGIISSLFVRENKYFLILTNNSAEAKYARIRLDKQILKAKNYQAAYLLTEEGIEISRKQEMSIYVPGKDGVIIKIEEVKQ